MLLDHAQDYRMVSIMRTQRANVVTSPYELEGNALSQIDEEQHLRWTNAYPKFNDGDSDDEEVKVEDHATEETKKQSISPISDMAFDNDTIDIKPRLDSNRLRQRFMQNLAQRNILETIRATQKTYQSMIIWDWDDTLMASTFLSPYQSRILEPSVRKRLPKIAQGQLDQLQDLVIKVLRKSVQMGPTYIITNAGQGWVELSSGRFLPKLYKELIMNSK